MVERRTIDRVRGTQDYWSADAEQLEELRRRLEDTFRSFGYRRIEVPALELAELHLRKSGLEIISKLYAFSDLGGRQLCLRPELTASVARAFVARPASRLPLKIFSSGPVFRYERPARGRYRQFTHCDVELIGAEGTAADAEVIFVAMEALDLLGLEGYEVTIGHVGILGELLSRLGLSGRLRALLLDSVEDVRRYGREAVQERLAELDPELFETGRGAEPSPALRAASPRGRGDRLPLPLGEGRGEGASRSASPAPGAEDAGAAGPREAVAALLSRTGPAALGRRSEEEVVERLLRKLDAGQTGAAVTRALAFIERLSRLHGAPREVLDAGRDLLAEFGLSDEPLRALDETVGRLDGYGAAVARIKLDLGLSRGLQYYTGLVFEIHHRGLGAESQVCGGGRYDDLIRALGGRQPVPALGFAFGVERVKLALEAEGRAVRAGAAEEVFVVAAAPEHEAYASRVARTLRRAGVAAHVDVAARPLRASLAYADREGFTRTAIVGAKEETAETVRVRDMASREERTVPLAAVSELARPAAARETPAGGGVAAAGVVAAGVAGAGADGG